VKELLPSLRGAAPAPGQAPGAAGRAAGGEG
jgi:hypothetical protein